MKTYAISEQLANAILNYLATKPYREVAVMIAGLEQLEPLKIPQPIPAPPVSLVPKGE